MLTVPKLQLSPPIQPEGGADHIPRASSAPLLMRSFSIDLSFPRDSIGGQSIAALPRRATNEAILSSLWRCGRWQMYTVSLLVIVFTLQSSWALLAHVFVGAYVSHMCAPVNSTSSSSNRVVPTPAQRMTTVGLVDDVIANRSMSRRKSFSYVYIPIVDGLHRDNTSCSVKVIASSTNTSYTRKCTDHLYLPGPDDMQSSIVTEWNLVCEREHWAEGTQGLFLGGVLLGGLIFPFAADHYGRKPVHVFCEVVGALAGAGLSTVTTFTQYSVVKFICGVLREGTLLTGVVWAMEFLPVNYRATASMIIPLFWSIDWFVFTLIAYLVREWRKLQLIIALPPLIALLFVPLVPESPIWLISKNKFYTLKKVILRLANRVNREPFPVKVITDCQEAAEADIFRSRDAVSQESLFAGRREYTVLDILRSRWLLQWTAVMGLNWFFNRASFLGLTFLATFQSGDKYLTFLLHGLVELPAYLFGVLFIRRFGRRQPLIAHQVLGSLFLIAAGCIPSANSPVLAWAVVALHLGAKYCMAFSYAAIVVYAPELYPTTLRMAGLGVNSVIGHTGGLVAPFLRLLHLQVAWLPTALLGVLGIPCALLLFLLPETSKRPMADTLEELEEWVAERRGCGAGVARLWRKCWKKDVTITVDDWDGVNSGPDEVLMEDEEEALEAEEEEGRSDSVL